MARSIQDHVWSARPLGWLFAIAAAPLAGCYAEATIPVPRVEAEVTVEAPPPPPPPVRVEIAPPPPSPEVFWVPGYHRWDGREYVWIPGRYERRPYRATHWVPAHWIRRPHGHVWVEGHWE